MKATGLCRKHEIGDATFYNWKAKYGGLEVPEVRRLKGLESAIAAVWDRVPVQRCTQAQPIACCHCSCMIQFFPSNLTPQLVAPARNSSSSVASGS
jgi:hypothetical protein